MEQNIDSHKKTILCKVVGSSKMGMGHFFRSLNLASKLEKEFRVFFHINNNTKLIEILQEYDINYFVDENIHELVSREGVDMLLFDQLSNDEGLFENLKSQFPCFKIISLDYFDYNNRFVDVIINLFNQNMEASGPARDDVQYYEGTRYAIIRDEFDKYITEERKISPEVKNILITFGGVDFRGNTRKILHFLNNTGMHDKKIDVILGALWKSELPGDFPSNVHFHHSISNISSYMAGADIAFSGAGTTIMELLCVGTPTIVIPQNVWEKRFARSLEEKGAVLVLGDEEIRKEDIDYLFNSPDSFQKRKYLSQKGKSLVDGRGIDRICEIIRNNLFQGE